MRVNILIYLLLLILVSISVQAFGVGYQYMEDNTLELYPGQNYMFKLEVQNKDGPNITAQIILNSTIATLAGDSELYVPSNSFDKHVFFNITVPENAEIGEIYTIKYSVTPMRDEQGQIPLAARFKRDFKVKVIEEPREPGEEPEPEPEKPGLLKGILIPVILIIIIIILILIWKKSYQASGKIIKKK
ncbi:hypothetical protein KY348_04870 [Candidatus Woesearchaeota archaeon]|nr:hypothetical protein [Candidatus Woesearchaeota archaeon]